MHKSESPSPEQARVIFTVAYCRKCAIKVTNTTAGVADCPVCHGPVVGVESSPEQELPLAPIDTAGNDFSEDSTGEEYLRFCLDQREQQLRSAQAERDQALRQVEQLTEDVERLAEQGVEAQFATKQAEAEVERLQGERDALKAVLSEVIDCADTVIGIVRDKWGKNHEFPALEISMERAQEIVAKLESVASPKAPGDGQWVGDPDRGRHREDDAATIELMRNGGSA